MEGCLFSTCSTDSPAYKALEGVVTDKKLLKDMDKLTKFCHTGSLEVSYYVLFTY